jgi:hypothetical protein
MAVLASAVAKMPGTAAFPGSRESPRTYERMGWRGRRLPHRPLFIGGWPGCPQPGTGRCRSGSFIPPLRLSLSSYHVWLTLVNRRAAWWFADLLAADPAAAPHGGGVLPFVMALKPRRGTWTYGRTRTPPVGAARALAWDGPDDSGDWPWSTPRSASAEPPASASIPHRMNLTDRGPDPAAERGARTPA